VVRSPPAREVTNGPASIIESNIDEHKTAADAGQRLPLEARRGAGRTASVSREEAVVKVRQLVGVGTGPRAVILVRLLVGAVFLSEGIQKFVFPATLGVGRFATIGFAAPGVLAPVVGGFEVACGALVLLGLFTRLAALPLLVIISVAIWTTKLPMLTAHGVWAMAHEARTDWCMWLGSLFLIVVGPGPWSFDRFRRGPR
jgi:putative oxidoreductase